MPIRPLFVAFASVVIWFMGIPVCHSASQERIDAATQFLRASEYERRLAPKDVPSLGIPDIDSRLSQVKDTPEIQAVRALISETVPKILPQFAEIYASKFDVADLQVLTAFAQSAAGRKYIAILPELHVAETRLVLNELLKFDPKLLTKLSAVQAKATAKAEADQQFSIRTATRKSLEQQAKSGDSDAMYRFAQLCAGDYRDPKDRLEHCFGWLMRAAENGAMQAQRDIAFAYMSGQYYGNAKSAREAFRWWMRAAEQGQVDAQFVVGSVYAGDYQNFENHSPGVDPDPKEAIRWFTKAAEQRHGTARRKLGEIYESGIGVEPNLQEALKWYKRASGL